MTTLSESSTPGRSLTTEPVSMMTLSKVISRSPTLMVLASTKVPYPSISVILFFLFR
ncbi:Uncharacterised protein [Mycobacteroides abscessus subsp. abscessus]|nr:Uncharacterised protein [Mycobacteroides abscessus subsp. abscessus]